MNRIDDVIHGRVRLGIIAYLARVDAADFKELVTLLETTAGNLSVHLRKLEDAGYIRVSKSFISRKSLTRASITTRGRAAFMTYLEEVRSLVDAHARAAVPLDRAVAGTSAGSKRKRA
ncbi:MAG: transcriptional regulator [Steroidobacteraceae bacterium]